MKDAPRKQARPQVTMPVPAARSKKLAAAGGSNEWEEF
jgi:hypothetical protein